MNAANSVRLAAGAKCEGSIAVNSGGLGSWSTNQKFVDAAVSQHREAKFLTVRKPKVTRWVERAVRSISAISPPR